jgi:hypothetical protein
VRCASAPRCIRWAHLIFKAADRKTDPLIVIAAGYTATIVVQATESGEISSTLMRTPPITIITDEVISAIVATETARET